MHINTFTYQLSRKRWSIPKLPDADSPRTLVIAFGAAEMATMPAPIEELRAQYPNSQLVGCSTAGEIAGTAVLDHSLSVAVARFEHTELAMSAVLVRDSSGSFKAGKTLAQQLNRPDLRAMLLLSEGLRINGSQLVRGIFSVIDPSVSVTGGLAGDSTRFEKTWVLAGTYLQSGLVTAVAFYGDHLIVGHGSKDGWDKFGPERVVTRSKDNVLYELDGEPALDLYQRYLGDKASGLPATGLLVPLSLRASSDDDKHLVRTVLAVDEQEKSMTFAGDVPQGYRAQFMKAEFDRLIGGASDAARQAKEVAKRSSPKPGPHTLNIAISSVGRRIVLGERTDEELEAVHGSMPDGTETVGFYSYGELCPDAAGNGCELHNQTMTLTVLSESPTRLTEFSENQQVSTWSSTRLPRMMPESQEVDTRDFHDPADDDDEGREVWGPRPVTLLGGVPFRAPTARLDGVSSSSFSVHTAAPPAGQAACPRCRQALSAPELDALFAASGRTASAPQSAIVTDRIPKIETRTNHMPLLVLAGALVIAVIGLIVLAMRSPAQSSQGPNWTASERAGQVDSLARGALSLPPGWTERPFVIEDGNIYLVARSQPAESAEAASASLRTSAVATLIQNMFTSLEGAPVHRFMRGQNQPWPEQPGQLTGELADRIARRYLDQFGTTATPERRETLVEQTDAGVVITARYRLSLKSYDKAVAAYRASSDPYGITVVQYFPGLEKYLPNTRGSLVVLAVESDSPAKGKGLVVGDAIVAVNGQAVSSIDEYDKFYRLVSRRRQDLSLGIAGPDDERVVVLKR